MKDNKEEPQSASKVFNPRKTHYFSPETKRLEKVEPYKLTVHNGVRYYEFPVGSGNLWWEDGETPAGRFEAGAIITNAAHKEYERPLTNDEKLAREYSQTKQENERLAKELEAIKKEKAELMQARAEASKQGSQEAVKSAKNASTKSSKE